MRRREDVRPRRSFERSRAASASDFRFGGAIFPKNKQLFYDIPRPVTTRSGNQAVKPLRETGRVWSTFLDIKSSPISARPTRALRASG